MKKIVLLLLLVVLMLTGCGNSHIGRKLVIGIDDDFAPLSFHNERNELVGFDIDLSKEACRRMGVTAEFKPIDWDNKKAEITSGGVDLIWNGLDITDERKEYMLFSKPYMDDRQVLLLKHGVDLKIYSEYDLASKIVGTQAGSISDDYINQNTELKDSLEDYRSYEKFGEAVEALKRGEIEVVICDELIARYEMNTHPDELTMLNVRIGVISETGIGFAKNNAKLRDEVQAVFDEMIKDGTAQDISEKWFQADLIKSRR